MAGAIEEVAAGLWTWTARHPEWHPGEWGAEVRSWAALADRDLLLLDALLPADDAAREQVLSELDRVAGEAARVAILISIGYHTRSAAELNARYLEAGLRVGIHGPAAVTKRLGDGSEAEFTPIGPGAPLPGGAVAYSIGKPRRQETPIHLPSHSAILFGDSVADTPEGIRAWSERPIDARTEAFYRERFNPTLEPLVALGAERLLFTHGEPILRDGARLLAEGLAAGPWYRRG